MNTKQRITRWIILGAALGVTGLAPMAASADEGMPRRPEIGRGRGADGPQMIEKLNLTEDQQAKLKDLRGEARKQAVLDRGKMADLRAQLRVGFMGDEVNAGKVRGLNREINDLREKMSERQLEQRLAMLEVLTPEQRATWNDLRQTRLGKGQRQGQRQGMRQGRGSGQRGAGRLQGANKACDGKGPKCGNKGGGKGRKAGACPLGQRGAGLGQGPGSESPDEFGFLADPFWWGEVEPTDGEVEATEAGLLEDGSR